jgi:hypothetical protein
MAVVESKKSAGVALADAFFCQQAGVIADAVPSRLKRAAEEEDFQRKS